MIETQIGIPGVGRSIWSSAALPFTRESRSVIPLVRAQSTRCFLYLLPARKFSFFQTPRWVFRGEFCEQFSDSLCGHNGWMDCSEEGFFGATAEGTKGTKGTDRTEGTKGTERTEGQKRLEFKRVSMLSRVLSVPSVSSVLSVPSVRTFVIRLFNILLVAYAFGLV